MVLCLARIKYAVSVVSWNHRRAHQCYALPLKCRVLRSVDFAAMPVLAPWADGVVQSSGLWTAQTLSILN